MEFDGRCYKFYGLEDADKLDWNNASLACRNNSITRWEGGSVVAGAECQCQDAQRGARLHPLQHPASLPRGGRRQVRRVRGLRRVQLLDRAPVPGQVRTNQNTGSGHVTALITSDWSAGTSGPGLTRLTWTGPTGTGTSPTVTATNPARRCSWRATVPADGMVSRASIF